MKKLLLFLALSLAGLNLFADDTAALQALITAGNTTLPLHHAAYTISSALNITNNFNVNGDTIYFTGTSGKAFNMATAGKKVSLAILLGPSDTTNSSGTSGIGISADNDTVQSCVIKRFTAYGINANNANTPEIYLDNVQDIGYMGVFLSVTGANKTGGKVEYNFIDRSMLPAATIVEGDLMIQSTDSIHTYSKWLVQYNTMNMPSNPTNINAECCEMRYTPFSVFQNNTCRGGSIGISVVRSDWVSTRVNFCSNQNQEGIEYADSNRGFIYTNSVTNQQSIGILVDGVSWRGAAYNVLNGNIISGCQSYCLELYHSVTSTRSYGDKFTGKTNTIDLLQASGLTLVNPTFNGMGTAAYAIYLDTSIGDVRMLGGLVTGYTSHVFAFVSTTATVTDKIYMNGITLQSTPTGYGSALSGGATLGSNILVN